MSVVTEKLTRERFRELYADEKPNFELIDGHPEQKAPGTISHARLQAVLGGVLADLGFRSAIELSLAITEIWEPVPDVAGLLGPETDEMYPSAPPAAVIEILSPSDRFTQLDKKCRRYAEWSVKDILVFDPVELRAWHWDATAESLVHFTGAYRFLSKPDTELSLAEVFRML